MQGFMNSKHVLYPIGYNSIAPNYIFPQLGLSFLFCPLFDSTGGLQQMKPQASFVFGSFKVIKVICKGWWVGCLRRGLAHKPDNLSLISGTFTKGKEKSDSRQLSSGPQPIHTDTLMSSLKTETNLSCIPTCPTRTIFHMYVWVPKKGGPFKDSVQAAEHLLLFQSNWV